MVKREGEQDRSVEQMIMRLFFSAIRIRRQALSWGRVSLEIEELGVAVRGAGRQARRRPERDVRAMCHTIYHRGAQNVDHGTATGSPLRSKIT